MQELEILQSSQPVNTSMFLEACAGAGKTFSIEHLVLRLLIHPDPRERRTMEQIALVTFTRAAAADLKRRVQSCIRTTIDLLTTTPAAASLPAYLRDRMKETPPATLCQWLEIAWYSMDRAFIGTIHGFCRRLLLQFGDELQDSLLGSPDQPLAKGLERERIIEFLRYGIPSSVLGEGQWSRLFGAYIGVGGVAKALQTTSLPPTTTSLGSWSSDMELLRRLLASAPCRDAEQMKVLWCSMAVNYRGLAARAGGWHAEKWKAVECLAEALTDPTERALNGLIRHGCPWSLLFTPEQLKQRLVEVPEAAQEFLAWARDRLLPDLKRCREPKSLLRRSLEKMIPARQRWRAQQGWVDPDQLIGAVLRCMERPCTGDSWAQRVAASLRTLVVDEFQDTDPMQWTIFERLKEHLQLVVVGDPKQSIYAFRSADLYTYLQASTTFASQQHWSLTRCYRSSREVVDALNRILEVFEGFDLPKSGGRLPVPCTLPRPDPPAPLPIPACTWALFERQKSGSRRWPSGDWMRKTIVPHMRAHLMELHALGLPWSEIAILVSDRYQAQEVAYGLSHAGIPHFTARGRDWSSRQALSVLRDWLALLCYPEEESSWTRLLGSPLIGWRPTEIRQWRRHPWIGRIQQDLEQQRRLLFDIGLQGALRHLLRVRWWSDLSPLRAAELDTLLRDLELLGEAVATLETSSGPLGRNWVWTIHEVLAERIALPDQAAPPPPDAVPIVTLHMSKGLEFEAVLLPGISTRTPDDPAISPEERAELDAEKLRQLYVAITRAKRHLWIPVLLDPAGSVPSPGTAAPLDFFLARLAQRQQQRPRQSLQEEIASIADCSTSSFASWVNSQDPQIMSLQSTETLPSQERWTSAKEIPTAPISIPTPPVRAWSSFSAERVSKAPDGTRTRSTALSQDPLPIGLEVGIALHEGLAQRVSRDHALPDEWWTGLIDRHGLSCSCELLGQTVEAAMSTPLWDGMCLDDIPISKRRAEVPFLLKDRSLTLKGWTGSIDVLASHEGGLLAIDWKSHWLGDDASAYTQEKMEEALQEGDYLLQARLYLAAMRTRFPNQPILGFGFVFLRAARLGLPATVWIVGDL